MIGYSGDRPARIGVKEEPQEEDFYGRQNNALVKIEPYREVKQEGYEVRSDQDDDDLDYEENPLIKLERDGLLLRPHTILFLTICLSASTAVEAATTGGAYHRPAKPKCSFHGSIRGAVC